MRVRLIWVGKTRNEHLRALIDEYLKRLTRWVRCEVTELGAAKASARGEGIEEEGKRISDALRSDSFIVLLDVEGREWSSEELAAQFEHWQMSGTKEIAFVIGGHDGVSEEVKRRAQIHWSLSRLTLTHEMARLLLVEQIYRAYTIIHGLPYQK